MAQLPGIIVTELKGAVKNVSRGICDEEELIGVHGNISEVYVPKDCHNLRGIRPDSSDAAIKLDVTASRRPDAVCWRDF